MAEHMQRDGIKGSTVIITVMFAAVVAYVAVDIWCYATYRSWIPYDASAIVGACFVAECVSLAKLKMAKEQGRKADYSKKASNSFMTKLGITSLTDFSDEAVQAASESDNLPTGGVGNGQP